VKSPSPSLINRAPLRVFVSIAALAVAWPAQSTGAQKCAAEGEPIHWIADYCMLKMETDDEIAASGCIDEEATKLFPSTCASNLHFKRAICEAMIRNGTKTGTVDQCLEDPAFKGSVVEGGGVGGFTGED
jgi:hypothetical protein